MTVYWTSTAVIALLLLASSYTYLFHGATIEGISKLGFPDFFRQQLAVLKILAAVLIVLPQTPTHVKEWAYAGIGLFLLTAIVAHTAHKDPIAITLINIAFFALLAVSHISLHKLPAV